jgi:hypothetical protein
MTFTKLSVGLQISHDARNCIKLFITLKQPISEMLGKIEFLLLIWNSQYYTSSARIKDKN